MDLNGFKIIAIRPLSGCNKRYLKILHPGVVYKFYDNYKFVAGRKSNINSEISRVEVEEVKMPDLYNIKRNYGTDLKINISAIVGRNGSGKSSLLELLYVFLYNISLKTGVLPIKDDHSKRVRRKVGDINMEVYFTTNEGVIKSVSCRNEKYQVRTFSAHDKIIVSKELIFEDLEKLFYTISVNYSHYALNSKELGRWIENVFHKNDSYQTPIVINPFRDEGKIDINNEDDLIKSRILSNILFNERAKDEHGFVSLLPDKIVKSLKFKLDISKGDIDTGEKKIDDLLKQNVFEIIQKTFQLYKNSHIVDSAPKDKYLQVAYKYLVRKLYSIQRKYTSFKKKEFEFVISDSNKSYKIDYKRLEKLVWEVLNNGSHISFKFKQALNFIVNYKRNLIATGKYITVEDLRDYVNNRRNSEEVINFIPPSFFKFDIKFTKGRNYNSLSSGEKQRIFSTSTILYHLYNLNSVANTGGLSKYTSVNIIFDEIELYFHPEWQRQFVSNMLDSIRIIDIPDINSLNILFITHSPFVLSDIPSSNILYLNQDGTPDMNKIERTFGANIHNLLEDSFFHNEGTVGSFAKDKIIKTLNWLKIQGNRFMKKKFFDDVDTAIIYNGVENEKEYHKAIVELIDEPVVKYQLKKMYMEFVDDNEYILAEMEKMSKRLK